jgi:outer membrane protein assembly factor BamE (lipoprotein component of BamABCDE complex)
VPKRIPIRLTILLPLAAFALSGCEARITTHGYAPNQVELAEIQPGIDTVFSLEETVGRPATTGLLADNVWYYVQSTVEHLTYNPPRVVERRVVAIAFDDDGVVQDVANYGLEDGRFINLNTRVTETNAERIGILQSLFGNIGGLSAEQLVN